MIENKKTLIVMAAIAILMAAAYMTLMMAPQKEAYSAVQDEISLLSINPVDVREAQTRLIDEIHAYTQAGGLWYCDGELRDYNATDLRITYISYLYSDNMVTDAADDLSVYGLAEPHAEASLETFSGERHTILFGAETVDRKSRYMMLKGQDAVYTMPAESFDVIFGKDIKEETDNENT